jgi:hypothetical protein
MVAGTNYGTRILLEMYFCDSLDYIKYTNPWRNLLCDRMEEMMEQTGENGFIMLMKPHRQL